jgi:hypothetical protein
MSYLIVVVVIAVMGLAIWNWQRSAEQKAALSQAGFSISDRFGGAPELVADRARREFAVVRPGSYERLPFADFEHGEVAFDQRPESEVNFRLELIFTGGRAVRINYGAEPEARRVLDNLLQLVKDQ